MASVLEILSSPIMNGLILGPLMGCLFGMILMPKRNSNIVNNHQNNIYFTTHIKHVYPDYSQGQATQVGPLVLFFGALLIGLVYLYFHFALIAMTVLQTVAFAIIAKIMIGAVSAVFRFPSSIAPIFWLFFPLSASGANICIVQIAWHNRNAITSFYLPESLRQLPQFLEQPIFMWVLFQALGLIAVGTSLVFVTLFASHHLICGGNYGSYSQTSWQMRWLGATRPFSGIFGVFILAVTCITAWIFISGLAYHYIR